MLFTRGAVLFGIEATPGTAVAVNPATDALLVDEPNYTSDMQKIERNFSKGDLSPFPFMIGRKLGQVTFKHEVRSNGKASGLTNDASRLAKLMRACGFKMVATSTAADRVTPVVPDVSNVGTATFATGGNPTNNEAALFELTCTTAGVAAAAKFTIRCNNVDLMAAPVTDVAASAAIALPGTGVTITPTINTALAVGDTFRVVVWPKGIAMIPVTDGFETATLEVYYDGLKHRLTGAIGTFSFSADAGGTVIADFTFMGVHTPVVDAAFPANLVFEEKLPALFVDALVTWGMNASLIVKKISFDLSLQAGLREDANHPAGFRGYGLQSRSPQGGFTPEATTEAQHPFWGNYESATQKSFFARVGAEVGNQIGMIGFRTQTSSLGYTDANNQRAYEVGLQFARYQGNDEIMFHFG